LRINKAHAEVIKRSIKSYLPDATVYLIGSRVNDHLKGGDIDILVKVEKRENGCRNEK
jgi:predicted nucleotidyltransferase